MKTKSYDILIVGGGIVGFTFALALAKETDLKIAILEAHSNFPVWSSTEYHHRVSAITLASKRIFTALQIWDELQIKRVSPFQQIKVWDADAQNEIVFASDDIALPDLGYIVENNLLHSTLLARIKSVPQITLYTDCQLQAFSEDINEVVLSTADSHFKGKLAVAADGANSWLRQQARITCEVEDYHQEAIVATVTTTLPHEKIARQVFCTSGPLAFLPLSASHQTSIVWSLAKEKARQVVNLEDTLFKQALSDAFLIN